VQSARQSERHLKFASESDTKVVGGGEPSLQNVADGLVELDGSTDSQDERFGRGELLEGEQSRRARQFHASSKPSSWQSAASIGVMHGGAGPLDKIAALAGVSRSTVQASA
jgi:hypothetical protein